MKINEIITTFLLLLLILFIGLVVLVFVFGAFGDKDIVPNQKQGQSREKITSKSQLATREQREKAFWLDLLPSNQGDSVRRANINNSVNEGDLTKLTNFTNEFLRRFETFDPERTGYAINNNKTDFYASQLLPYMVSGQQSNVISREESSDLPGVCPFIDKPCDTASTWVGGSSPKIKAINSSSAYITTTGLVRFSSTDEFNYLDGRAFLREYAILLEGSSGEWKVSRVTAKTLEEVAV
jgi:hypothetical protein